MTRANSLPRALSVAAFWCLIECHFEWPLIGSTLSCGYLPEKPLMDAQVAGQLRMERRSPHSRVTDEHRMAVVPAEHVDIGPHGFDDRCPDEHSRKRIGGQARVDEPVDLERRLERCDLRTVGVTSQRDIERVERRLIGPAVAHFTCEQDEAGARPEGREAIAYTSRNRLQQT